MNDDEDQGDGAETATFTPPDADKGIYVFASGRKGSGKSVVCRKWFDRYPYDRVVIDVTHDLRADFRRDGIEFDELRDGDLLPARLPASKRGQPDYKQRTWVYCPDAGAATAVDDMDRVAGLAIGRGPTLIWFDEYGTVTTGNKTPPNVRRILHHGRHDQLTALFACPRPMDIDGLAINQADLVYTFATANPDDRDRIAKNIGFDPKEFSEINASLPRLGKYYHTVYDQTADRLWIMDPMPMRKRSKVTPYDESGHDAPMPEFLLCPAASLVSASGASAPRNTTSTTAARAAPPPIAARATAPHSGASPSAWSGEGHPR